MGVFAFSACRKRAAGSSDGKTTTPTVQTQEEQSEDTPKSIDSQDDVPLTDPEQEELDEEDSEISDLPEELKPDPEFQKPTEGGDEDSSDVVSDPAKVIDPNVDWEHGWQS